MVLAAARDTEQEGGVVTPVHWDRIVRNGVTVFQGGMVVADANGELVPANNANGVTQVLGRCEETVVGDGALRARYSAGCYWYTNSGTSITADDLFRPCYAVDDEAVHLGDNGGARTRAGVIVDIDATLGVCVLMSPYLYAGGVNIDRRAQTYTNADLTAAALTQTINLGAALPATAFILGYRMNLADAFDSPGAGTLDIQLGDTVTDDDSLCAAFDGYTASTNEGAGWVQGTRGAQPNGPPTGTQLALLFTATVDNLSTFTNGDLDVEVFFVDLATFL